MRKAALGSIFVLVCVTAPAQAQETLVERLEAVFANRVPAQAVTSLMPVSRKAPAAVEVETQAAGVDDCPPVDTARVRELIHRFAAAEGLDADLAEAVAAAESGGGANPGLSTAGAAGVMQLMPGTASDLGVKDRCDPEANIRGGIRYLKQMLDEFGDPVLMLAAYNAGPHSVYKASGIPLNSETVKYVAKVLNRWKYSRMLNPAKAAEHVAAQSGEGSENSENQWRDGHVIDFN